MLCPSDAQPQLAQAKGSPSKEVGFGRLVGSMVASSKDIRAASSPTSSCDGQPLAALAMKVPKVRLTGDLTTDTRKSIERDAFVRIVDKLSKYPQYIMHLHGIMLSQDLTADGSLAQPLGKLDWTGNYSNLSKIPKTWVAQYLMNRARALGVELTQTLLNKLEEESVDNLRVLFSFETQTTLTLSFPTPCHDKHIASKTFNSRAAQVGSRLKSFIQAGGISATGALDFSKGGCYELIFDEASARCVGVKHCTGEEAAVPQHVLITPSFDLVDNHLDHLARVELPPCNYYLMDFFKAVTGCKFTQHIIKDKKGDLLKAMAQQIADQLAAGMDAKEKETVEEDKEVFKEVQQKKANMNLVKARTKLQEKKADRTARRTIKLGSA
jgi:hypothetical protein